MKKIISLFQRNYEGDRLVRDEIVPGAEWVVAGEGVATRKWDGTCCMVREGKLYKRYDAKAFTIGKDGQRQPWNRKPPDNWEPAQEPDGVTGHWPGWVPVGNESESKWHREAWEAHRYLSVRFSVAHPPPDGTYELIGPKVQGDPERVGYHMLVEHGYVSSKEWQAFARVPRDFEGLKEWLSKNDVEGVVWHHPDGRMVKIKAKDFGIKRVQPQNAGQSGELTAC